MHVHPPHVHPPHVHRMCTARAPHVRRMCTACALRVHRMCTAPALPCAPHVHCTCTACALPIQDRGERQEFRAKTLLQLANTERIEQLKREKDRLGWDIRLDNTRPACAVALDQDAGLSASRDSAAAHHQPSRDGSCATAAAATEPSSSSLPPPSKQSPRHAAAPPLQSTGDGHRHVAIRLAPQAAGGDEQPRCGGGAAAAGILREPRVYTSGAASTGCNPVQSILQPYASYASGLQAYAIRVQPYVSRCRQRWRGLSFDRPRDYAHPAHQRLAGCAHAAAAQARLRPLGKPVS